MAYDDRETGLTVEDRGSKLGLPQNQDAEANVLAAMLLSPEVVEEAQVELQPDDFYRPIHKTIYTAMVDMYNSRIPIDSISLIDYLRSINKLDAVGGEAYILELMGQTLSLVNWQHHAAIVRRDSMLRELIGAGIQRPHRHQRGRGAGREQVAQGHGTRGQVELQDADRVYGRGL